MTVKRVLLQEDLGMVTAMRYAASPTAFNSATLAAALAAIGVTPTTLVLSPGTWTLTSNVSVPATCTLQMPLGTTLAIGGGVTVTLANPILSDDPVRQLFSGAGVVVFGVAPPVVVLPQWWGAVGDGVANDLTAIRAAFAASRHVHFPAGTYYVGDFALNTNIIDLSPYGDGIRITTQGKVTLFCNTTFVTALPRFFYLQENSDFYCEPICFLDSAFDGSSLIGAVGFYLNNDGTMDWGNCIFESVTAENMGVAFMISALAGTPDPLHRIRGITIHSLFSNNCYYGFHTQEEGDDVSIANLHAYRTIRAFYVYGSRGITAPHIYVRYPRSSTGQVIIVRQVGGLNTEGIHVNLVVRDVFDALAAFEAYVHIQHIDLLGGTISDVRVHVDIEDLVTTAYDPVRISNAEGSGLPETSAASLNYTQDIHLSGTCVGDADRVQCVASFADKRQMHFIPGLNFLPSAALLTNFQFCQLSRAQTDAIWGADGVAPSLGDGTLLYDLDIHNGIAHVTVTLTIGSTSTMGTGGWYFQHFGGSLTYLTARATSLGTWFGTDLATRFYSGVAKIDNTSSSIYMYADNSVSAVGFSTPFTWATGDTLVVTIQFPVSG